MRFINHFNTVLVSSMIRHKWSYGQRHTRINQEFNYLFSLLGVCPAQSGRPYLAVLSLSLQQVLVVREKESGCRSSATFVFAM